MCCIFNICVSINIFLLNYWDTVNVVPLKNLSVNVINPDTIAKITNPKYNNYPIQWLTGKWNGKTNMVWRNVVCLGPGYLWWAPKPRSEQTRTTMARKSWLNTISWYGGFILFLLTEHCKILPLQNAVTQNNTLP